ncbi:MAG: hypothetical protein KDB71_11710 [Mycobacterium sp.]|nr:hypothetical protein [Mycobacterium sp.]
MKKALVRGGAVISGVAALFAVFGCGPASAVNEYKGMTYGEASGQIWGSGARPVIASRQGTYLSTYNCIVSGSHKATLLNSSGSNRGSVVMVDLNCNYPFATANAPGNSLASPEGRAAREQAEEQYAQQQAAAQAAQAAAEQAAADSAAGGG